MHKLIVFNSQGTTTYKIMFVADPLDVYAIQRLYTSTKVSMKTCKFYSEMYMGMICKYNVLGKNIRT